MLYTVHGHRAHLLVVKGRIRFKIKSQC
jgi:hypothetical protein